MVKTLKHISFLKNAAARQQKAYGELDTRLLSFITPAMLTVLMIVVYIVTTSIGTLQQYFETNVVLNGLIIGTLCFTMGLVLANLVGLYRSARFLKHIDRMSEQDDEISDEQIDLFHEHLKTKGRIFNISNMHDAIDRIRSFGGIQFTDTDARLIKSKLGFRLNLGRSGIGFLSGLLVMLGLLGTFLGLLKTIDAVGTAMGSMSNLGAEGGMESFIESISAPLQGMGLAFSSSLFGLSGSLLSGFFSYLSSGAQNRFIEDVGRWIDNRIPRFDPAKVPEKQAKAMPSNDDLKSWMLGYVYLANKTNKRLGGLFGALTEVAEQSKRSAEKADGIVSVGHGTNEILNKISEEILSRTQSLSAMEGLVSSVDQNIKDMTEVNVASKDVLGSINTRFEAFHSEVISEKAQIKELLNQVEMMRKVGVKFGVIQKTLTDELGVLAVALKDQSSDRHAVVEALSSIQKTLNKAMHEQKKASAVSLKVKGNER